MKTIEATIEKYFKGFSQAEPTLVAEAFSPTTVLYSTDENKLSATDMQTWIKGLEVRQAQYDQRESKLHILNIDRTEDSAVAKIKIDMKIGKSAYEFTDYLSLLEIEGQWKIVGKIYTAKVIKE